MNILITGSNGQLGSEILEISKLDAVNTFFFTDRSTLDITIKEKVLFFCETNLIDTIINCAAYTAVDKAEDESDLAFKINSLAVKNLVQISEQLNIRLVHISTDYVFDGTNYLPYSETNSTNPQNIYGKTKLEGEKYILDSKSESLIIRTSWVYSSYGSNFVKTIGRLANEKKELNVIFDQVGSPTYANDLAKVCLQIISNKPMIINNQKIFHYSNEGVCSWYDFAQEIVSLSKIDCKINPIESSEFVVKAKRPNYSVLNKKLIKSIYSIEIPYWRDSLKNCLTKISK